MSLWQPLQALTSGGSAPRSHATAGIHGDVRRLDGAQTAGSSPRSGGLGPHGRQRAGLDVVDVAVHRDAIGDERALPCLLYTSPSPRDGLLSRMPSSA